jgi:signal transduction histidine kinase
MYTFWGLRAALCRLPVRAAAPQRAPAPARRVETFAMIGAYLTGGAIALMSALYMGHESYYYAGMSLTLVAIGVLVPVGPLQMLGAAAADLRHLRRPSCSLLDPSPPGRLELERLPHQQHLPDRHRRRRRHRRLHQPPPAPPGLRRRLGAGARQRGAPPRQRARPASYLEISEKNREIEDAYRSKSQFLDNISHELRTPLTCILTPLEGLLAGDARGELRGVFEDMHSASRQLYDLINDLLDYSKYGARDQPLQRDPVDLIAP